MLRVAFWGLVALDFAGILLLFVLGLAAAGSTKDNPLHVALVLLVLPSIPLVAAVLLFMRATSPVGRIGGFLLAAAPLLILVVGRSFSEIVLKANSNESGELTFFRAGPMRDIAEAIKRNDVATVDSLLPKVNVNKTGLSDVTLLLLAARQLRETPTQHDVLRSLLRAGAEPNKFAQYEAPLEIAIQESGEGGLEPVKLMLDAGADPNLKAAFGEPLWFSAIGKSSTLETLTLLLDRGADVNAMSGNGATALFTASNVRNWKAALLLLQRGADWRKGVSVNGMPFKNLVDGISHTESGDADYVAVRQFMQ